MSETIIKHPSHIYTCEICGRPIMADVIMHHEKTYHRTCLYPAEGADGLLKVKDQILRPTGKWICEECEKPIYRNVAVTVDGRSHHFGCLKRGHSKPAFHCLRCGAELTRAQTSITFVDGSRERGCSRCGGPVEGIRDYTQNFGIIRSVGGVVK